MMEATTAKVVGPGDGKAGFLGSIGVRFMIDGEEADERFSLVEHPMSARALAAPLHRHAREDEYSYIVEGRVGALLGGPARGSRGWSAGGPGVPGPPVRSGMQARTITATAAKDASARGWVGWLCAGVPAI